MGEVTDDTVERVLAAAHAEFERVGLRRAVMGRIATSAGIGRATLYRRFPDKAGLVDAVLQRHLAQILVQLQQLMAGIEDPQERLVEGFAETVHLVTTDVLLRRVFETEPETVLPIATTHGTPSIAMARMFLAEQLRLAEVPDGVEVEVVAEIAVRLVHSFMLTPSDLIDTTRAGARELARNYLVPSLFGR